MRDNTLIKYMYIHSFSEWCDVRYELCNN